MDESDKRQVGEQIEPGGRAKAPGRLKLLQQFVNSHNHELPAEWDRLGTPDKAKAWLREKHLVAAGDRVSAAEVDRLRAFRKAIRALAVANNTGQSDAAAPPILCTAGDGARLKTAVDHDGRTYLAPASAGVDGAIATLLAILHEAQLTGDWPRLKGCRHCGYAFFDRSKNRSATWCAMSICGNRAKNRTYYHRHRPET